MLIAVDSVCSAGLKFITRKDSLSLGAGVVADGKVIAFQPALLHAWEIKLWFSSYLSGAFTYLNSGTNKLCIDISSSAVSL